THWAWRRPVMAAAATPLPSAPPATALVREADGSLRFTAKPPPGARTLEVRLKSSTAARITSLAGVPLEVALAPGKWVTVHWQAPGDGLDLAIKASAPGRLDVRYIATVERWPEGAASLSPRPSDLMAWDNSDSTFITGSRAYAW
ncbi:hypothetical protein, partial [uncultured Phenylobacterium sp.]|uniref:hypothetical protein n=1 Tax=uncultured Phenylobacterium sp. TaxID=349273 RepID=UPI0025FECFA3